MICTKSTLDISIFHQFISLFFEPVGILYQRLATLALANVCWKLHWTVTVLSGWSNRDCATSNIGRNIKLYKFLSVLFEFLGFWHQNLQPSFDTTRTSTSTTNEINTVICFLISVELKCHHNFITASQWKLPQKQLIQHLRHIEAILVEWGFQN